MKEKREAIAYVRDPKTRNYPLAYEQKFSGFLKAITEGTNRPGASILIAEPWVIGDNYEEIVESLSRLAGTDVPLLIVNPTALPARN